MNSAGRRSKLNKRFRIIEFINNVYERTKIKKMLYYTYNISLDRE